MTEVSLNNVLQPEARFVDFRSFLETRVCGTEFVDFATVTSLESILTSRFAFQYRYACKQFHARKLTIDFAVA
jgi:hypothetical protein